jgi:GT2 family glycosyltransferase
MDAPVTAVIVSYADRDTAVAAVRSLLDGSLPPREMLIVDNNSSDPGEFRGLPDGVRVLRPGANLGYTGAVNLAAREAGGDWLFLLNPDATVARECLIRLIGAVDGPDVAIVGAQVLLPDGRVNAGENPVNIVGVSWSGSFGAPREHGEARDVAAVSGAAMLVRRERLLELGGLCPFFFMYVDDTDLAWRVRLAGGRVRYCPEAVVVHDYEFDKGARKWFYLERNRAWALLSNLQLRTLVLLAPALLATEAAVALRALRDRWFGEKLAAWGSLAVHVPSLMRWRRGVQRARRVSDGQVLALFAGALETDLLERSPPRWANRMLELYRRVVLRLLGAPEP